MAKWQAEFDSDVLDAAEQLSHLLVKDLQPVASKHGSEQREDICVRELRARGAAGILVAPALRYYENLEMEQSNSIDIDSKLRSCFDKIDKACRKSIKSLWRSEVAGMLQQRRLPEDVNSANFARVSVYAPGARLKPHCDSSVATFTLFASTRGAFSVLAKYSGWWKEVNFPCVTRGTDFPFDRDAQDNTTDGPDLHRVCVPQGSSSPRISLCFFVRADPLRFGPRSEFDLVVPLSATDCWANLMTPLLVQVFAELGWSDARDIGRAALVCRRWSLIARSKALWSSLCYQYGLEPSSEDVRSELLANLLPHVRAAQFVRFKRDLRLPNNSVSCVKLVLVGDSHVGKSNLIKCVIADHDATEVSSVVFELEQIGEVDLSMWDTNGSSDFDYLRPLSYPPTDVFMIVFSLASRKSFRNVNDKWLPEVDRHCPGATKILVGTTADSKGSHRHCAVSSSEVLEYARESGFLGYFETCAFQGHGVHEALDFACRTVLQRFENTKQHRSRREKCAVQ